MTGITCCLCQVNVMLDWLESSAVIRVCECVCVHIACTVASREIETTVLNQPSVFLSKIGLFCRSLILFHGKRDLFPT